MNPAEPIERIQCQWCQSMNEKDRAHLPRVRRAARHSQPGERIGLARSPAPPRHDRVSLQLQHLPGGRRDRAGGRDQPGRGRLGLLRAPRHAVEGRQRAADGAAVAGRHEARLRRHAVHHQRGHRVRAASPSRATPPANWWCCRCIPAWSWTCASTPFCSARTRSTTRSCASRA